jgi:hypothetical protein
MVGKAGNAERGRVIPATVKKEIKINADRIFQ